MAATARRVATAKAKSVYAAKRQKGRRAVHRTVGTRRHSSYTVNAPKQLW